MSGKYAYAQLLARLNNIRDVLSSECTTWTQLGAKQVEAKTQLATQLAFQFTQLEHRYNKSSYDGSRLEISLPNKTNPFAWPLTLFPAKPEEINSHLKAIIAAIEDVEPRFDPRAVVNPEAAKLLWGSEADKKTYFRKLRRSAQDSMEF